MSTSTTSRESEDVLTTTLAQFLSDMRGLLQEHKDGIRLQLEAWSARHELHVELSRTNSIMGHRVSEGDLTGHMLVPRQSGSGSGHITHRLSSSESVMSQSTDVLSRIELLRQNALERSGWRKQKTSKPNVVQKQEADSPDGSGSDRLSKRTRELPRSRFHPDRIVQHVSIDRQREPEFCNDAAQNFSMTKSIMIGGWCCCGPLHQKLRRVVKSWPFDLFCGVLILGNTALLGVEVNCLASTGSVPRLATLFQTLLNFWYFVELGLRYWAAPDRFCAPEEWRWNAVDAFTMIPSILDLTAELVSLTDPTLLRIFRALRMLRIMRLLRIAKQLTYVLEFRKMAFSLMSSTQTLLWSALLIFFVIYNFALWFTQSAAFIRNSNAQVDVQVLQDLEKCYGGLGHSIRTLFMSITNGISWNSCLQPLLGANDSVSSVVFCTYVAVCCFGLLNVVTSIFVESAMLSTQHYKDLLVEDKILKDKATTEHMKRIFSEIAGDRNGSITFEAMETFLDGTNTQLHAYFEALGLEVDDARAFFRLLDIDGSGKIDIDEFCEGCMKLKGEAKSFDLNCMIYEGRAMLRTWSEFMYFVEQEFSTLKTDWRSIASTISVLSKPRASQPAKDSTSTKGVKFVNL